MEWTYLNLGTLTVVSGTASTITPSSSKKFYLYNLPNENQDYFKDDPINNNQVGSSYFMHELQLTVRKLKIAMRNEILALRGIPLAAIVETHDGLLGTPGTYWLLGANNGIEMETSQAGSGAGRDAFNGYVLKFNGKQEEPAIVVPSGLIAALTNS